MGAQPKKAPPSQPQAERDRASMEGIRSGDPQALADLYDQHAPTLLAVCRRLLRDAAEAEDVLEEIFFEVWQRADRYDPGRGSPAVYLVTVARSRAIDRLRQRRRRPEQVALGGADSPDPTAGLRGEGSPLGDAMAAERRRRVRKALETLDPAERRVVELSFFEGLTHREIATRLSEPLGTVKTRIRRGLMRMRNTLRSLRGGAEAA